MSSTPAAPTPPLAAAVSMKTRSRSSTMAAATTAALGMASPTGSASETSDYQRSTPSPRDDPNALLGKKARGERGQSNYRVIQQVSELR